MVREIEGPTLKGVFYRNKYEVLSLMKTHCPRLYRKSALESVGGWPTVLFKKKVIAEDYLIFLMLAKHFKFHWIDETLYHQRRHDKNMTIVDVDECQNQLKVIARYMLKRWGNRYKPKFIIENNRIVRITLLKKRRRLSFKNKLAILKRKVIILKKRKK